MISLGKVLEFDSSNQTAMIKLLSQEVTATIDRQRQLEDPVILHRVPVHVMKFGDYQLTTPVSPGDICLVLQGRSGITHWTKEGREEYQYIEGQPEPAANRIGAEVDTIAIVGLSNELAPIPAYQGESLELRNTSRNQRISLHPEGLIEIIGAVTDIITTKAVNVTTVNATVTADTVAVTAADTASLHGGSVTVTADESITMSAPAMSLNGMSMAPGGNMSGESVQVDEVVAPSVTANGKELADHEHIDSLGGRTTPNL